MAECHSTRCAIHVWRNLWLLCLAAPQASEGVLDETGNKLLCALFHNDPC